MFTVQSKASAILWMFDMLVSSVWKNFCTAPRMQPILSASRDVRCRDQRSMRLYGRRFIS